MLAGTVVPYTSRRAEAAIVQRPATSGCSFLGSIDRVADSEDEGVRPTQGCRVRRGSSVKAAVGDRITVHGLHVGDATRCGEVLAVKGAGGEPPYVVCWDDGHEAVFVPGSGVRVDPAGAAADGPG